MTPGRCAACGRTLAPDGTCRDRDGCGWHPPSPYLVVTKAEGKRWAPADPQAAPRPAGSMNAFEERNRARKASRLLVQAITEDRTTEDLVRLHPEQWIRLADRAGVSPPSFLTMTEVVDQLERRGRRRSAA